MAPAPGDNAPESAEGLAKRVSKGAAWSLIHSSLLRFANLAAGIAIARILAPADFGVYAVALVAFTLLRAINDLGAGVALVQWPGDVRVFASTVMSFAITSSLTLYVLAYFLAPSLANFTDSPDVVTVVRILGLCLIVDSAAIVPVGILARRFLQGRRFAADAAAFLVGNSLIVTMALTGHGAMSFAVGTLAGSAVAAIAYTILSPIRVTPGWDRNVAARLLPYGLPLAASNILVLSATNLDKLIVGVLSTPAALGLYVMAFNQSSWPINIFSEATRRVALAGFSRSAEDRAALNRYFGNGLALLMAMTVPACVMLMMYAEPLLDFVYGEVWAAAASALTLLAVFAFIRVAIFVAYDVLLALDRGRALIRVQTVWLVALLPSIFVGTRLDGIRGAAIAQLCVAAVVAAPLFARLVHRAGLSVRGALLKCRRPLVGGLLITLSALCVRRLNAESWAELLLGLAIATVLYIPVVWPMRQLLPAGGRRADAPSVGIIGVTDGEDGLKR